ncbi:MAG: ATP-binding protein [Prolixibacteraceae bacterium]|jgi:hypothetical protein|nr:ATP-binding protein [Prolixibacteraceae bacterium]
MKELSLHILDIVQNSIRAKASKIELRITEDIDNNQFEIQITDNGIGMDKVFLDKVTSPFVTSRKTRNVGLGISLLKQNAEQSGGFFTINSESNKGTIIKAVFEHQNIDRPILGDVAGTMTLLIGANPQIHFIYLHKKELEQFYFDTEEVKNEIDTIPIQHPDILKALKELINENLNDIKATIN